MPAEQRIIADIQAGDGCVIALIAPAGFGKTEIARAISAASATSATIVASPGAAVRSLLAGFAGAVDCAVLEAADRLDDRVWRDLLVELLARRPKHGSVIVCSRREPVEFSFADVIEPNRLLVLRPHDLALTVGELRARLPCGARVDDATLSAIHHLTQGWPLPSLALLQAAARGLFQQSCSIGDAAFSEVFDWLDRNVLRTLTPASRDALMCRAVSRDLTPADAEGALGQGLFALLLRARFPHDLQRCEQQVLSGLLGQEDPIRAARLCVNAGELADANEILKSLPFDETFNLSGYAYPALELEQFRPVAPEYEKYPLLWLQMLPCRYYAVPPLHLAHEGERVLALRGAGLDLRVRRWIGVALAMLFAEGGQPAMAERWAESVAGELPDAVDAGTTSDLAQLYVLSCRGRYHEALEQWRRVAPRLLAAPSWYALYLRAALAACMQLGDASGARDAIAELRSLARAGGSPGFAAFGELAEAMLARREGHADRYQRSLRECERLAHLSAVPLLWEVLAAIDGRGTGDSLSGAASDASSAAVLQFGRRGPVSAAISTIRRRLEVDVACGEIRRGGTAVRVSEGTLQLVTLLAVTGQMIRRASLMDRLWPDLDGDNAANALKVCIHRARAQLGESGAIVSSQRAIGLSDVVSSNYRDILALADGAGPPSDALRTAMSRAFEGLTVGLASGWAPWDWFVPYRTRLVEAMQRIGTRLVEDALARGKQGAALHLARTMADVGSFGEDARAALVLVYPRTGDGAVNAYERHPSEPWGPVRQA